MTTMTLTVAPMSGWTSRTVVPACAHASLVDVQGTRAPIAVQADLGRDVRTAGYVVDAAGRTKATFPGTSAWRPPSS